MPLDIDVTPGTVLTPPLDTAQLQRLGLPVVGLSGRAADSQLPDYYADRALAGASMHVWVAVRTDGRDGQGTELDPRDGSTAVKFDAIMRDVPEYTAVHLMPGTYQTYGDWQGRNIAGTDGWSMKRGVRVIGTGRKLTVVQLLRITGISGVKVGAISNAHNATTSHDMEVHQLTVDLGHASLSDNSMGPEAVLLLGSRCHINAVEVINCGNYGSQEVFPLFLGPEDDVSDVEQCTIQDCWCSGDSMGSGGTRQITYMMITAGGATSPFTSHGHVRGGLIARCQVLGNHTTGANTQAFGMTNQFDSQVLDCYASNVVSGYYQDSRDLRNFAVKRNQFFNVDRSIDFANAWQANQTFDGIEISSNMIRARPQYGDGNWPNSGIRFWRGATPVNPTRNVRIRHNDIGLASAETDATTITAGLLLNQPGQFSDVTIEGNTIRTPNLARRILIDQNTTGVRCFNNRDAAGNYVEARHSSYPESAVTTLPLTRIDEYTGRRVAVAEAIATRAETVLEQVESTFSTGIIVPGAVFVVAADTALTLPDTANTLHLTAGTAAPHTPASVSNVRPGALYTFINASGQDYILGGITIADGEIGLVIGKTATSVRGVLV